VLSRLANYLAMALNDANNQSFYNGSIDSKCRSYAVPSVVLYYSIPVRPHTFFFCFPNAVAIYIASFFATTLADEDIQEGIQDMEKLLLSLIKDFPHIPAVSSNCFLAAARPTRFDAPSVHAIEEHIWKNQSSESTIKELVQALRKVHSTNFMQKILENPAAPPATIVLAACHYADEMHVVPQEQRSAIISVLMLLKESQVSRSLLAAIHYTLCLLNHFPLHQYVISILNINSL
jgi:hypothetical protein